MFFLFVFSFKSVCGDASILKLWAPFSDIAQFSQAARTTHVRWEARAGTDGRLVQSAVCVKVNGDRKGICDGWGGQQQQGR